MTRNGILVWVLTFSVACGGSTPTSPTPTPNPPEPFVFKYQEGVTSADKRDIEDTAPAVKAYFLDQFGKTLSGTITFDVRVEIGPNASAIAGNNTITIYTLSPFGWTNIKRVQHIKTIAHELFHILQQQVGWSGRGWLLEGSAEYTGYKFTADLGLMPFDTIKNCQVNNYGPSNEPMLRDLVDMFSAPDNRYVIAWLAWDYLLGGAGFRSLGSYLGVGNFSASFGKNLDQFYDEFETYRRTLRPTAATNAACQILNNS